MSSSENTGVPTRGSKVECNSYPLTPSITSKVHRAKPEEKQRLMTAQKDNVKVMIVCKSSPKGKQQWVRLGTVELRRSQERGQWFVFVERMSTFLHWISLRDRLENDNAFC